MSEIDREKLRQQLIEHEGIRLMPYRDTVGKLTIGVGRNLDDRGISNEEAFLLLSNDIENAMRDLDRRLPEWRTLGEIRQRVMVDMCFNLGISRLMGFKRMMVALKSNDYEKTATEMLSSFWHVQTGRRAKRLALMMQGDCDVTLEEV